MTKGVELSDGEGAKAYRGAMARRRVGAADRRDLRYDVFGHAVAWRAARGSS